MEKDTSKKRYFADNERYADLINGFIFQGEQIVSPAQLMERDTQTGFWTSFPRRRYGWKRIKYRDLVRKAAFGVNFAVMGIENQEEVHYLMPLRAMVYDAGEYESQAAQIRKKIRKRKGISRAEFLSGFGKECRLFPCITLVLYYGDNWDGGRTLHSILDFTDIPEPLRRMVGDYHINLVDIKKLQDTSVYKTDLKQVFDFIRFSEDKEKLWELVENDSTYKQMDEDAYDVAISFTKSEKLIDKQQFTEGGKVNMCKALVEIKEEGIQLGIKRGIEQGIEQKNKSIVINMIKRNMSDEDICAVAECEKEFVNKMRREMKKVI